MPQIKLEVITNSGLKWGNGVESTHSVTIAETVEVVVAVVVGSVLTNPMAGCIERTGPAGAE